MTSRAKTLSLLLRRLSALTLVLGLLSIAPGWRGEGAGLENKGPESDSSDSARGGRSRRASDPAPFSHRPGTGEVDAFAGPGGLGAWPGVWQVLGPRLAAVTPPQQEADLLSDGQFVWGPNVGTFDISAFLASRGSSLALYGENVEQWAAYSGVNPRVLLAVLETGYGMVTRLPEGQSPDDVLRTIETTALSLALSFYDHLYTYGSRRNLRPEATAKTLTLSFADGQTMAYAPGSSSGTFAVASALATGTDPLTWQSMVTGTWGSGFAAVFAELFPEIDPLDSSNNINPLSLPAPDLFQFPFPLGAAWKFSGVHSWFGGGGYPDRSSMDFLVAWPEYPDDPYRNAAAAAGGTGLIRTPYQGRPPCWVEVNHGGGWKTSYYHLGNLAAPGPLGTVGRNDPVGAIGEGTCNGGSATGPHVHLTLWYNGALYDLEGLQLSGWTIHAGASGSNPYTSGYIERGGTSLNPYSEVTNDYHILYGSGNDYGLYFEGNQASAGDRLRVRMDDPATAIAGPPIDVGAGDDFTFEWWMMTLPGDNASAAIACGANDNWTLGNILLDSRRSFEPTSFGVSLAGGRIAFGVRNAAGTALTLCSATRLDDGLWHHVAVQRNRWSGVYADGYLWLYVDGQLEASGAGPGGDISYPDGATPGVEADPFLYIGGGKWPGPAYRGWMDEMRVSPVIRYSASFQPTQTAAMPDTMTGALFHLDEGTGDRLLDVAGYAGGPTNGWLLYGGNPPGPNWGLLRAYGYTFVDVPTTYWAWSYVESIFAAGLTAGCSASPPSYCPDRSVTRAEMAVFLKKGIHGASYAPPAPDGSAPFADILGHWAEAWMEDLYDEGLTAGFPDGTYRPQSAVTRGEMAVFILKGRYGSAFAPPAPNGSHPFSDIDGSWAEPWIEQLYDEGLSAGYPDGTYRPENTVSRAEIAVFLVRGFNVPVP